MVTSLARPSRKQASLPAMFSPDPFGSLREEFDNLLSSWFVDKGEFMQSSFIPSLDVKENDSSYEVKVDLPGVQANEIKVQLSQNLLTISGERKSEKSDGQDKDRPKKGAEKAHIIERFYGAFSRSIMLPGSVNNDQIDATYADGVLTVSLPKVEECKSCQIPVKG